MAGRFEGLSELEWRVCVDIMPPEPTKRGRGMPHTPFRKVVNTLLSLLMGVENETCKIPDETSRRAVTRR
jgi:hypothetical protein